MGGQGGFGDDVRASLRAWQHSPALPILTLALVVTQYGLILLTSVSALFGIAVVAVLLFELDFWGTQRIWYLRAFGGDKLEAREIFPLSYAFLGASCSSACSAAV